MRRRGWVFIETVAAMALLAVLAGIFAVGINRQQMALLHLQQSRSAMRLAESALNRRTFTDSGISARRLTTAATPPAGFAWIKVTAKLDGRTAELIGLVPTGAQP